MAAAIVQKKYGASGSTSVAVVTDSAVTAANQLVAIAQADTNLGSASISDDKGNTWALEADGSGGSPSIKIWRCTNAAAGVTTVTLSGSANSNVGLVVYEVSGANTGALDAINISATGTASNPASNSVTASTTGLAIAFLAWRSPTAPTCDPAWSEQHVDGSWTNVAGESCAKSVAAGSISHGWSTSASAAYQAAILILKDAAGGASTPPFRTRSIARRMVW